MITPRGREIRCVGDPTYACQQGCPLVAMATGTTDTVPQASYEKYVQIGNDADAGDIDAINVRKRRRGSPFSQLAKNAGCKRLNP